MYTLGYIFPHKTKNHKSTRVMRVLGGGVRSGSLNIFTKKQGLLNLMTVLSKHI